MIRGTTPTHIFTVPFDTSIIKTVRVIYEQNNKKILYKRNEDVEISDNTISLKLTQEDTLKFKHGKNVKIQLRVLTNDGEAMNSAIIVDSVQECLDDEVLV